MKQRKKRGRLSPAAENNLSDLFSGMTYAPAGTYGMGQAASLTVVRRSMLSSATNFNGSSHLLTVNFSYVMKNNETMAKRLLGVILVSLVSIFIAKSQDLVFDGITPAPGSEISSFDFVLKFDLSKVIETNGSGEYGVGWVGYHNDKRPEREKSVTIYKGDPSDGIVIGRTCSSNCNGSSAGFSATSNININIEGEIPEPGITYTVVINNEFKVYALGSAGAVPNSFFDCFTSPLTYTFIGAAVSGDKLSVASCSINANQSIDALNEITFTFSQPVSINSANPLVVKENDAIYAASIDAILSDDKTSVTYKFDNVPLLLSHSYVISLPAGAVASDVNSTEINAVFNVPVTGSYVGHFTLESSNPTSGQKTIFSTVEGIFDMPTGFNIYVAPPYFLDLYGYLYKNDVSEENLIGRLTGEVNSTKNGIIWTNTYALEPGSTYIINKPAGEFRANDIATGKLSNEWYNGEVNVILNTPTAEESGIPKVEFQAPVLGVYNDKGDNVTLSNGDKVSEITTIDFLQKDLRYSYNGEYYGITCWDNDLVEIYDITNGTPVLVTKAKLSSQTYETTTYYYNVLRAKVNSQFYEGHRYRLVVPAGTVTIGNKSLMYYAGNDEYAVDFEGAQPTTVELISCSVTDNAELSELPCVTWKFRGDFVRNPELSVSLVTSAGGGDDPTFVSVNNNETVVQAFFYFDNGKPFTLRSGAKYTLILPEGIIYNTGDPSIKNEEMRINLTGIEKTPEVITPEYVNVDIVTNDFMTTTQKAVKGQSFTYSMTFDSAEWQLISAKQGNKNLTVSNGMFECPALSEDASIDLEVDYKGPWASDEESTGIFQVPNTEIRIFRDGSFIVVDGVTPDNTINVYNVAGMLVNTTHVSDGHNLVRLTVAPDQLYIVMVDGVVAKIRM